MDPRWGRLTRWSARGGPVVFGLFWLLFWAISGDLIFALAAAGLAVGAAISAVGAIGRAVWSSRPPTGRLLSLVIALMGAQPGLMATLLLIAFGVALPWALVAGAGIGVAMTAWCVLSGMAEQLRGVANLAPRSFSQREDAARQLAGRRRHVTPLRFPGSSSAKRLAEDKSVYEVNALLNDVQAQLWLGLDEADYDLLRTALDGLRKTLPEAALDPGFALLAAQDLVSAESTLAQRSHDRTRYAAAVDLYGQLAREHPEFDWARPTVHEQQADYQALEMMLAATDFRAAASAGGGDAVHRAGDRVVEAYQTVKRELTAAIELSDADAEILPQYMCQLGQHLGGGGLQTAYTPYQVQVSLATLRLTILDAGHSLGSWTVADGAGYPHPRRTDVPARLADPTPSHVQPADLAARHAFRHPGHLRGRPWHRRPARLAGTGRIRPRGQPRLRPGPSRRAPCAGPDTPREPRHDHQLACATTVCQMTAERRLGAVRELRSRCRRVLESTVSSVEFSFWLRQLQSQVLHPRIRRQALQ